MAINKNKIFLILGLFLICFFFYNFHTNNIKDVKTINKNLFNELVDSNYISKIFIMNKYLVNIQINNKGFGFISENSNKPKYKQFKKICLNIFLDEVQKSNFNQNNLILVVKMNVDNIKKIQQKINNINKQLKKRGQKPIEFESLEYLNYLYYIIYYFSIPLIIIVIFLGLSFTSDSNDSMILFKKIKIKNYTKKLDSKKIQVLRKFIKDNHNLQKLIFEIINNQFKINKEINRKKDEILSILKLIDNKNLEFFLNSKSKINLSEELINFIDNWIIYDLKLKIFTLDVDLKNKLSKDWVDNFLKEVITGKKSLKVNHPNQITSLFENFELSDLIFMHKDNICNSILFQCLFENENINIIEYLPKKFLNEKFLNYEDLINIENKSLNNNKINLFEFLLFCLTIPKSEKKININNLTDKLNINSYLHKLSYSRYLKNINRQNLYNFLILHFSLDYSKIIVDKSEIYKNRKLHTFHSNIYIEKSLFNLNSFLHFNFILKSNEYNYVDILLSDYLCSNVIKNTIQELIEVKIDFKKQYTEPKDFKLLLENKKELLFNINESEQNIIDRFTKRFYFNYEYYLDQIVNSKLNKNNIDYFASIFSCINSWDNLVLQFINNKTLHPLVQYIKYNEFDDESYNHLREYFLFLLILDQRTVNIYKYFDEYYKNLFADKAVAYDYSFTNFQFIPNNLKSDKKFLENSLIENPSLISFLNEKIIDEDFLIKIIIKKPVIADLIKNYDKIRNKLISLALYNIDLLQSNRIKQEFFKRSLLLELIIKNKKKNKFEDKFKDTFNLIPDLFLENVNFNFFKNLIIKEVYNNLNLLKLDKIKKEFNNKNLLIDLILKTKKFEVIYELMPENYLENEDFFFDLIKYNDKNIFNNSSINFKILKNKNFILRLIQLKGFKYFQDFSYKLDKKLCYNIHLEYLKNKLLSLKASESIIYFNPKEDSNRIRVFEICLSNTLEINNINFEMSSILDRKICSIKFIELIEEDFYILENKNGNISIKNHLLNSNKINLLIFREKYDFENNLENEIKIAQNIFFRILSIDTSELKKYILNSNFDFCTIDLQFLNF